MNKSPTFDVALKKLLILLGLLILSPLTLNIAFKALNKFTEVPKIYIAYGLFILGAFLIIFTVYFGFKVFKTIADVVFNSKF